MAYRRSVGRPKNEYDQMPDMDVAMDDGRYQRPRPWLFGFGVATAVLSTVLFVLGIINTVRIADLHGQDVPRTAAETAVMLQRAHTSLQDNAPAANVAGMSLRGAIETCTCADTHDTVSAWDSGCKEFVTAYESLAGATVQPRLDTQGKAIETTGHVEYCTDATSYLSLHFLDEDVRKLAGEIKDIAQLVHDLAAVGLGPHALLHDRFIAVYELDTTMDLSQTADKASFIKSVHNFVHKVLAGNNLVRYVQMDFLELDQGGSDHITVDYTTGKPAAFQFDVGTYDTDGMIDIPEDALFVTPATDAFTDFVQTRDTMNYKIKITLLNKEEGELLDSTGEVNGPFAKMYDIINYLAKLKQPSAGTSSVVINGWNGNNNPVTYPSVADFVTDGGKCYKHGDYTLSVGSDSYLIKCPSTNADGDTFEEPASGFTGIFGNPSDPHADAAKNVVLKTAGNVEVASSSFTVPYFPYKKRFGFDTMRVYSPFDVQSLDLFFEEVFPTGTATGNNGKPLSIKIEDDGTNAYATWTIPFNNGPGFDRTTQTADNAGTDGLVDLLEFQVAGVDASLTEISMEVKTYRDNSPIETVTTFKLREAFKVTTAAITPNAGVLKTGTPYKITVGDTTEYYYYQTTANTVGSFFSVDGNDELVETTPTAPGVSTVVKAYMCSPVTADLAAGQGEPNCENNLLGLKLTTP